MRFTRHLSIVLALGLGACAGDDGIDPPIEDDNFGLDAIDGYLGAPDNSTLATEAKFDQVLPAQFDLVATQSGVKSQGSRGVCSIFGSIALMEHLYISEGTIANPDFSEQFLQWSAKSELGSFPNTGGSSARSNIQALNQYGTVEEADWAYESSPWGTSDDEACTGDSQPTRCYTNGEPPAAALMAQRWTIPRGRWINSSPESIKAHMFNTNTAVQAGGDFFYQAWIHGGSLLPRYTGYREHGYVLAPNAADIESSNTHRAGHSFLLVGWDDELEVQAVDAEGNLAVDEAGEPIMQKGFFLFKNSWGTGWATSNPHGAGYGWIAYEYVEDHLSAYASGLPELMLAEACGDGVDNDRNGLADCADPACSSDRSCMDPAGSYSSTETVAIPDNDPTGASSTIEVAEGGTISGLSVDVDITHTYRGDLTVTLSKGSTSVTLVANEGAGADDIVESFDVSDFDGEDAAGTWTLTVVDSANADTGNINGWSLTITRCAGGDCDSTPETSTFMNETLAVIPDDDATGATSSIEVGESATINAVRVTVNLTHPFMADLTVSLEKDGTTVELMSEEYVEDTMLVRTFTVDDFNGGDMAGTWNLNVVDTAPADEGTLNGWSLEVTH
ncbi:MAG: proprotein convertase P-domain-containing protein [Deltaproteobacteria bacterium]|nr:proprotein convertase P-domain-containing protein [Deltaproteobacteria bacterium]